MTHEAMPRRALLKRFAGIGAGAALISMPVGLLVPATAEAADRKDPVVDPHPTSLNGWALADKTDAGQGVWSCSVPGTGFSIDTRLGMVEILLVHAIRRWHYEIETLREGEVIGWRPVAELDSKGPESNQASGTAVAIRPAAYGKGLKGGLTDAQTQTVRSILDDCGGIVRWGGDDETPYEALFYIDTPPAAVAARSVTSPLGKAAGRLRTWNQAPGMGAGAAA
ncbi:hypothetical protein AB0H45_13470 [Streptomyces atroolivaceus]|uniref:Secreted protein n=1 Tax=Streptomyces atroolivaceus TaxID=66869 RepID=A0ABV9V663_STRAZ|nr:hypothetical protein [Streptomyces atroolivaceus]